MIDAIVKHKLKPIEIRWRDVKFRAFENADHRTYVDLKDKWKTLVHTARISPQQRRGEPVPQELLDRVLAAHAYWSQHQAKQHSKHHQAGVVKAIEGSSCCVRNRAFSVEFEHSLVARSY
ncbi:Telomere repeat-binding protein 4, partial [Cucurbita argyrosperma subsp. argyrosperma]